MQLGVRGTLKAGQQRVAVDAARRRSPAFAGRAQSVQVAAGKMVFYTNPHTRSQIIEWYAKEIKLDYDSVAIDMGKGEHKQMPFLGVNPFGKLPAVKTEDGTPIFESGAILLYVADKYGGLKTAEERAEAAKWILFANATFGPAMFNANQRASAMPAMFGALDSLLKDRKFISGDAFSVSDVAMGAYIAYVEIFFPNVSFAQFKNVTRYMTEQIKTREAFKLTIGTEYS